MSRQARSRVVVPVPVLNPEDLVVRPDAPDAAAQLASARPPPEQPSQAVPADAGQTPMRIPGPGPRPSPREGGALPADAARELAERLRSFSEDEDEEEPADVTLPLCFPSFCGVRRGARGSGGKQAGPRDRSSKAKPLSRGARHSTNDSVQIQSFKSFRNPSADSPEGSGTSTPERNSRCGHAAAAPAFMDIFFSPHRRSSSAATPGSSTDLSMPAWHQLRLSPKKPSSPPAASCSTPAKQHTGTGAPRSSPPADPTSRRSTAGRDSLETLSPGPQAHHLRSTLEQPDDLGHEVQLLPNSVPLGTCTPSPTPPAADQKANLMSNASTVVSDTPQSLMLATGTSAESSPAQVPEHLPVASLRDTPSRATLTAPSMPSSTPLHSFTNTPATTPEELSSALSSPVSARVHTPLSARLLRHAARSPVHSGPLSGSSAISSEHAESDDFAMGPTRLPWLAFPEEWGAVHTPGSHFEAVAGGIGRFAIVANGAEAWSRQSSQTISALMLDSLDPALHPDVVESRADAYLSYSPGRTAAPATQPGKPTSLSVVEVSGCRPSQASTTAPREVEGDGGGVSHAAKAPGDGDGARVCVLPLGVGEAAAAARDAEGDEAPSHGGCSDHHDGSRGTSQPAESNSEGAGLQGVAAAGRSPAPSTAAHPAASQGNSADQPSGSEMSAGPARQAAADGRDTSAVSGSNSIFLTAAAAESEGQHVHPAESADAEASEADARDREDDVALTSPPVASTVVTSLAPDHALDFLAYQLACSRPECTQTAPPLTPNRTPRSARTPRSMLPPLHPSTPRLLGRVMNNTRSLPALAALPAVGDEDAAASLRRHADASPLDLADTQLGASSQQRSRSTSPAPALAAPPEAPRRPVEAPGSGAASRDPEASDGATGAESTAEEEEQGAAWEFLQFQLQASMNSTLRDLRGSLRSTPKLQDIAENSVLD